MMTRIYAWAFADREALEAHVERWRLAQERDHKKLGRELGIFAIDNEVGRGLPLWLPNGTVIRDELEKLAKELEFKAGYQRVATPQLAREALYFKSGHLPYYAADIVSGHAGWWRVAAWTTNPKRTMSQLQVGTTRLGRRGQTRRILPGRKADRATGVRRWPSGLVPRWG